MVIRRRLRSLREEAEQTPGCRFSMRSEFGEPDESQQTAGWLLEGKISEALDTLDSLARDLFEARSLPLEEADFSLLAP